MKELEGATKGESSKNPINGATPKVAIEISDDDITLGVESLAIEDAKIQPSQQSRTSLDTNMKWNADVDILASDLDKSIKSKVQNQPEEMEVLQSMPEILPSTSLANQDVEIAVYVLTRTLSSCATFTYQPCNTSWRNPPKEDLSDQARLGLDLAKNLRSHENIG
jgi:hypothetical protein